jgi:hypothetical protein
MSDDRPFTPEPPRGEPQPPRSQSWRERHHSTFWPIVLIAVGAIWLLNNLGWLPTPSLWLLPRLWPLLLIAVGLDLLVGRRWPALGALVGLALVGLVIAVLFFGARWGLSGDEQAFAPGWPVIHLNGGQAQTDSYTAPLGSATSARLELHLQQGRTTVKALTGSTDLIQARLTHIGPVNFQVSGDREKTVLLDQDSADAITRWFASGDLPWDISLSPAIPLDLQISGGSGSANLDLSQLKLSALQLNSGSGSTEALLPAGQDSATPYKARLRSGSGSARVVLPANAAVDLECTSGSGSLTMSIGEKSQVTANLQSGSGSVSVGLPAQAAVRVDVRSRGSGSVSLPSSLKRVSGSDKGAGVWETAGFDSADAAGRIVLTISSGSGSVSVH